MFIVARSQIEAASLKQARVRSNCDYRSHLTPRGK